MNFYLFLVSILQITVTFSSKPSEDLWKKVIQYISEKKMNISKTNYFIFDEENYTVLDNNSDKMNILYNKQANLYKNYDLRSFLFICKNLNRAIEDAITIRNNIRNHLINNGVYINNTIFVLISVESIESIIYTGNLIKKSYISDYEAEELNNNIKQNIKNKEYYKALENFLINIEKKFKNINNNNKISLSRIGEIIYMTVIFIVFLASMILVFFCCCKCICSKDRNIFQFYLKHNYNNDRNSTTNIKVNNNGNEGNNISIGGNSYGNNSIGGNSAPSFGDNSIGGASGGAI